MFYVESPLVTNQTNVVVVGGADEEEATKEKLRSKRATSHRIPYPTLPYPTPQPALYLKFGKKAAFAIYKF